MMLAGCSAVLPHESNIASRFQTYDQLVDAYSKIDINTTRLAELSDLGFDPRTTPNIEVLSYVQIIDRFVPSDAVTLERVPPPVRGCIEAKDRCSAYLYRVEHSETRHNGYVVPDLIGIERDTTKVGWSAEIALLVRDDRVVYKLMAGQPYLENRRERTQPLGPLQDLGNMVGDGASP